MGGLVGSNRNREAKIVNCYSGQKVKGKAHVGGLVGINEEGALRGAVLNSYYDKNTTGRGDTGKGTPKTTEEMMRRETFEGWDFDDIWAISEGESSPYFQYQIQEEEKKSFWDRLPFF